jgi:hypothetical protein
LALGVADIAQDYGILDGRVSIPMKADQSGNSEINNFNGQTSLSEHGEVVLHMFSANRDDARPKFIVITCGCERWVIDNGFFQGKGNILPRMTEDGCLYSFFFANLEV